jgi:hypothetical protein
MLDALSTWAKGQSDRPLDQRLWDTLRNHASAHHSDRSLDHTKTLLEDFRRHGDQPMASRQRRCGQVLEDALRHLVQNHFEWRNSTPLIRHDRVLQVQSWLAECNPDPLQCYLWAVDCLQEKPIDNDARDPFDTELRRLRPEILRLLIHGPILPGVGNPVLQQLREEGLAEIHRHLNGNALPNLIWAYLVLPPYRLFPKELAGNVDGLQGRDCIALIRTARDLRAALIRRLYRERVTQTWDEDQRKKWNQQVLERLSYPYESLPIRFQDYVTFKASGLPNYRDPAALLPLGEDELLLGERVFLFHAFELFHKRTEDAVLAAALHAYLLIQNLIWRALIQPRDTAKGFDRFDKYHSLFLRKPEKSQHFSRARDTYFHRLIQAQRTGGVRWMELRTTPFDGVWQETHRLDRALQRILKKDISDRSRELRVFLPNRSSELPTALFATPAYQDYHANRILEEIRANSIQAGLIFHFIKQTDPVKVRAEHYIIPCRHSKLRRLVKQQAMEIRQVHRSRRYGHYIVGLDAANAELKARPEVFAPAIRWLREIPCRPADPAYDTLIRRFEPNEPQGFGLTYHAGEDFRHLLSGLRAVDEALRFLKMGPGDRIGHGLALGLLYNTWCERVGGEVAMPRGEHLDDLVWLREKLAGDPGRFGRLLFAIDDKIRRLAWEIYGHLQEQLKHDPTDWQLLHLAWTYRNRDPLPYSNLDKLLKAEPLKKPPPYQEMAQALWRAYHFNPGVRVCYEEPMRVSLEDPALEHWHEAVTWVQDAMLHEIREKRIAIEINPTSNLCIGPLIDMQEHPVFRWHPPEDDATAIRPYLLVGSDDPGVFGTELAFEYATLSRAAEERGATPRDVERWLRELRDNSKAFCFLETVRKTGR